MSSDEKDMFRKTYIMKLSDNLAMLRAKAGVSQAELSEVIGVARQTYSAFECGRKTMGWNTFMSLILFFKENEKTSEIIKIIGIYTDELESYIRISS